jgi:hypothetical protein
MIGGYAENKQDQSDHRWPSTIAAADAIRRRCVQCHDKSLPLPLALSDNRNIPPWDARPGYVLRHLVYNLTRPEKSLILLAPLSKQAGGYGLCKPVNNNATQNESLVVFVDTNDLDYQKILALCVAGSKQLDTIKRFDMPDFRPRPAYVREMKRYGILPKEIAAGAAIDIYETDREYWQSLWHKPETNINTK